MFDKLKVLTILVGLFIIKCNGLEVKSTLMPIISAILQERIKATTNYCAISEFTTTYQKVNFAWTLDGVLSFLSHIQTPHGMDTFCNGGTSYKLEINQTNLKFHPEKLTGNWSASVYTNDICGLTIKMIYETWDGSQETLVGQLEVKQANEISLTIHGPNMTTKILPEFLYYNYNYYYNNSTNYIQSNRYKFVTQLEWLIDSYQLESMLEDYNGHEHNHNHPTTNTIDPDQPLEGNNIVGADSINLIFHFKVVKKSPIETQFEQNCQFDY